MSKILFLKDRELSDRLNAVVKADWFKQSIAYAKSEFMDTPGINEDMLKGARLFETTLLNLSDPVSESQEPVESGLSHQPPELKSRTTEKKEKT